MTSLILALALTLYLAAAAAYAVAFARPALGRVAKAGLWLAAAAFAVHGAAIAVGCRELGGRHLLTVPGATALAGWLAAGAFLAVQRAVRTPAAGAFALPLVLAAVLPDAVAPQIAGDAATALAQLPALRVHVTAAAGGLALFGLAGAIGLMYLLQERELKGKRFGPLLARLPPLHALDRVNAALVGLAFAVFTVAVASGTLVARARWCEAWQWDGQLVTSALVWLVFGALVLARWAGSHGRRQALLTMTAFVLVVACLVGVRQVRGATRHADLGSAVATACGNRS